MGDLGLPEGVEDLVGLTGEGFNWESWEKACEKKSVAVSVLDSLVTSAVSRARAPDLLQRVIRKSVQENLVACLDAVGLNFVARADNELHRQSLATEPEQVHTSADTDTWARGVLTVKRQPKQTGQSASSRRSNIVSTPKKLAREASITGDAPVVKARAGRESLKTSRLVPIADRSNRKKLTKKQVELEQRLRDELEARKNAQEVLRQADANDVEEKKRLQALQQELRGKEYAYDQSGQVVVLNRLDPDRLPPPSVSLKFRFSDKSKPEEPAAMGMLNGKRPGGGELSPTKKSANAFSKVVKPVPEFVKKTQSGLPSMMESMKIVPGVTIREGDLVKAGPKTDKGGLTRSEYFMKKQLESTMNEESEGGMAGGGSTNTWGENTFNGQEFGILQMIQSAEDPAVPASARKASTTALGGAGASAGNEELFQEEDINLVLTGAPDWGENTPVSPNKMSLPRPPKLLKQGANRSPRGRLTKENSLKTR